MKRRGKYFITILVIIIVAALGMMYIFSKNTTFQEVVLDKLNLNEISSIEIIKSDRTNEKEITVTDPSQIIKIMDAFSQMKLKESTISNINYITSYWITLKSNENRNFGITLYDNNYIFIYEYNAVSQNNQFKSYIITNDLDPVAITELNNLH